MTKVLITANDIIGQMAMWAVRQHPYHKPPRLDEVTQHIIDACNDLSWDADSLPGFRCRHFADTQELRAWLQTIFGSLGHNSEYSNEVMRLWNSRQNGREGMGFASRYDSPAADDDFIDIDALIGNVALGCVVDVERMK